MFFTMPNPPRLIPGETGNFFSALRRARLAKLSSSQPSGGPFQPKMGMSQGLAQFDPEIPTQVFLQFTPCGIHPNRFLVKMETFCVPYPTRAWAK